MRGISSSMRGNSGLTSGKLPPIRGISRLARGIFPRERGISCSVCLRESLTCGRWRDGEPLPGELRSLSGLVGEPPWLRVGAPEMAARRPPFGGLPARIRSGPKFFPVAPLVWARDLLEGSPPRHPMPGRGASCPIAFPSSSRTVPTRPPVFLPCSPPCPFLWAPQHETACLPGDGSQGRA